MRGASLEVPKRRGFVLRRVLTGVAFATVLVLLAVLPPLINLGRYQRRVASAMSGALGRPVHFDSIAFHVMPLPALTITNFIVAEDSRFGAEPVLRANTVEARLRLSSLWRRRVEISRISLQSPSVNLVHNANGEWNLGWILMRASQIESAPTAQQAAGGAPRFPYIEATDARVNVKQGEDKLPFSLTGAAFALWLPSPDEWHVRIAGKPLRTDTDVSDVGELQVEGTLGRAADLAGAPVNLHAAWKPTPLGEMSKMIAGTDAGWRGAMSGSLDLLGTLGHAKVATDVHLRDVRRAEFVPAKAMQVDAHCEAAAEGVLHSLKEVHCAVPTEEKESVIEAFLATQTSALKMGTASSETATAGAATGEAVGVLTLLAEVPSVADWRSAEFHVQRLGSPQYWLDWLRLFSQRLPAGMGVTGVSTVDVARTGGAWSVAGECRCDIIRGVGDPPLMTRWQVSAGRDGDPRDGIAVHAAGASLGGESAAGSDAAVDGVLERDGYMLRYGSSDVARLVSVLLPPLADGMPAKASGPLMARRGWASGQPQVWSEASMPRMRVRRRRRR